MAGTIFTVAPDGSSDALFRIWGKAVSDTLSAGGFIQTADTGQIDWATVTKPSGYNTAQGYEIWRSNDAVGSLHNFYFKIEYGSGGATFTQPAIWITVGWGSNGSGTLTGNASTRTQKTGDFSATSYDCTACVKPYGFVLSMFPTQGAYGNMLLAVERLRDHNGAFLDLVEIRTHTYGAYGAQVCSYALTAGSAYSSSTVPMGIPGIHTNADSLLAGSDVGVLPIFPIFGGVQMPLSLLAAAPSASFPTHNQSVIFDIYGSTATWKVQKPGTLFTLNSISMVHIMRYD